VTSIKEAQATIEKVFGTINILLLALTSISLVVAVWDYECDVCGSGRADI